MIIFVIHSLDFVHHIMIPSIDHGKKYFDHKQCGFYQISHPIH